MAKQCSVCAKKKHIGGHITRRGLAKKSGGIGTHVVKNTKREFRPNLQKVRMRDANGNVRRGYVCTRCIRSGAIQKA